MMASTSEKQIGRENGADGTLLERVREYSGEEACERPVRGGAPARLGLPQMREPPPMRTRCHVAQRTRHGTRSPLTRCFLAIWLAPHFKRGISGLELARQIGVRERTERCRDQGDSLASGCAKRHRHTWHFILHRGITSQTRTEDQCTNQDS